MDTTCFGRSFGVMVLFDSISKQALSVVRVESETNALYLAAVKQIPDKGIKIQSIICDGKKRLPEMFPDIPVPLCQFHQARTVNRYLTRKPKSAAAQELAALAQALKNSSKKDFETALKNWYETHKTYLNERTKNEETGQSTYTHKRLRSAYNSLKRNLPWLFAFGLYPERHIPKTTNPLESRFGDMKQKIRCHQGLRMDNKMRFIKDYFSTKTMSQHEICPLEPNVSKKA